MLAVLAAAVVLAAPPGFYESYVLEPAASYVAGKPAHIYCSRDVRSFKDYSTSIGEPFGVSAFTTAPGSDSSMLESDLCGELRGRLAHHKVDLYDFAGALLTLVHEATHQHGSADEGATECTAIHLMPRVAVRYFGFRAGKQLRALMAQAWAFHRTAPPEYQAC